MVRQARLKIRLRWPWSNGLSTKVTTAGETFISIADTEEFVRTVRKADVVSVMAFAGQPLAAMFVRRKAEEDSFAIKFPARYRKIIVECLD